MLVSGFFNVFSLASMSLTFFAMCTVCDDHLVPAIEVFIDQFNMPEDVAGVTLIAMGSAAPELLLNIMSGAEGTSDLSLSALLGSSIIAFGLIPPLCIIMTPHKEITLKTWPIMRETFFYVLGLVVFLVIIEDGEMSAAEAGTSVGVYVIYVLLVVIGFLASHKGERDSSCKDTIEQASSQLQSQDGPTALAELEMTEKGEAGGGARGKSDSAGNSSAGLSAGAVQQRAVGSAISKGKAGGKSAFAGAHEAFVRGKEGGDEYSDDDSSDLSGLLSSGEHDGKMSGGSTGSGRERSDTEGDDVEDMVRVPKGLKQVAVQNLRMCGRSVWGKIVPHAKQAWGSVTAPVGAVIKMTIPSLHSGESETDSSKHRVSFLRACGTLFMSITWIAMLAWCLIGVSETLIAHMDVGTSTVGATLVALGSEIPDTIASIALARSGYNDGAMAGAIGSQVINITLGVGLPVLLSCWLTGHNIKINMKQTRSLWLLTALMVVVIGGYVAITIPMHMIWRQLQCNAIKYTRMGRKGAWGLLVVLAVVTVAFVWLNEEVMDEINDDVVTKLA